MAQEEYRPPKNMLHDCHKAGLIHTLLFLVILVLGILSWADPIVNFFHEFILVPWFIFQFFISLMACFYNLDNEKVIVSDDGIEYKALGVNIQAKWSELRMWKNPPRSLRKLETITVENRNVRRNFTGIFTHYYDVIPIFRFGPKWRNTSLGKEMRKYAPQLFKNQ